MHNRIKQVRKHYKLNQTEFGKKIGVSRDTIANLEGNRIEIKDYLIISICREYHVSETWLRDGTGEMFEQNDQSQIDQLAREYNLNPFDKKILENYIKLSENQRQAITDYIKSLAD